MQRPTLHLIKDFKDGKFLLYWADVAQRKRVSPYLASTERAEEWWLKKQFSLYEGNERRRTIIDRRKLHKERAKRSTSSHFISAMPEGRRYTDTPIEIALDKSRESLQNYLGH